MTIDKTFVPEPETNHGTLLPSSRLTVYPSRFVPGVLSLMLVSDDDYREIQGGLRLTREQAGDLRNLLDDFLTGNEEEAA